MFSEKENVLHAGSQLQPGKAGPAKIMPKTPMRQSTRAPQTPFPMDRENFETAKKGGMTQKKSLFHFDPSSYITPVGPRIRVPLGGKTTNAKAPASELKEKVQLQIKLSPVTKSVVRDNEDEIPEIEYMPPKAIDLPDIPDDFIEPDYNLIKNNLFTGAYASYLDGRDENGKTKLERKMDAVIEQQDREMIAEAETAEPVKPKSALRPKSGNVSGKKVVPAKGTKTTARPTSRVGRQTPTFSRPGNAPTIPRARSKTPAANTTRNTNQKASSTSRPTSRVGGTSTARPTSRTGVKSNGGGIPFSHNRSTSTATSSIARPRSVTSTARPAASQSTAPRSGAAPTKAPVSGNAKSSAALVAKPQKPKKTIEEDTEEALSRLVFADTAGDESDHERVDVADLVLDGDDDVFQF